MSLELLKNLSRIPETKFLIKNTIFVDKICSVIKDLYTPGLISIDEIKQIIEYIIKGYLIYLDLRKFIKIEVKNILYAFSQVKIYTYENFKDSILNYLFNDIFNLSNNNERKYEKDDYSVTVTGEKINIFHTTNISNFIDVNQMFCDPFYSEMYNHVILKYKTVYDHTTRYLKDLHQVSKYSSNMISINWCKENSHSGVKHSERMFLLIDELDRLNQLDHLDRFNIKTDHYFTIDDDVNIFENIKDMYTYGEMTYDNIFCIIEYMVREYLKYINLEEFTDLPIHEIIEVFSNKYVRIFKKLKYHTYKSTNLMSIIEYIFSFYSIGSTDGGFYECYNEGGIFMKNVRNVYSMDNFIDNYYKFTSDVDKFLLFKDNKLMSIVLNSKTKESRSTMFKHNGIHEMERDTICKPNTNLDDFMRATDISNSSNESKIFKLYKKQIDEMGKMGKYEIIKNENNQK